jgi:hypothetical protein
MNYSFASLFNRGQSPNDPKKVAIMEEEIRKVGGLLHFTVRTQKNGTEDTGWTAQCDEIEGIMTGGDNPDPSDEEIRSGIRQAIHTAFDISSRYRSSEVLRDVKAPAYKLLWV